MSSGVVVKVGPQGRIVIPASLRAELEIDTGDTLLVRVEGDQLIFEPRALAWRRIRGMGAHLKAPGERVVDELIAERRAAFADEERESAV